MSLLFYAHFIDLLSMSIKLLLQTIMGVLQAILIFSNYTASVSDKVKVKMEFHITQIWFIKIDVLTRIYFQSLQFLRHHRLFLFDYLIFYVPKQPYIID